MDPCNILMFLPVMIEWKDAWSMFRISMKFESKARRYGYDMANALGSPCQSTLHSGRARHPFLFTKKEYS